MKALLFLLSLVFIVSVSGILIIFLLNPLLLGIMFVAARKITLGTTRVRPSVSLLIVVHNAEDLIIEKIKNSLSLQYPSDDYEIIVFSDGSTDGTLEKVESLVDSRVHFFSTLRHEGKNNAINKAIDHCSGEIIVFSDVDAILETDAIMHLIKYFADPSVGGVCGQRVIGEGGQKLKKAQSAYIRFDSIIKKLESRSGSISSNDGKLYAFRRALFQTLPAAVTDDLYVSLSIVKQKYRFLFEPEARAFIKVPSRNPSHEIQRRRRIVSRSLRGIFLMKGLLNPLRYGIFSLRLLINKVFRRFLPICLILLFMSSLYLALYNPVIAFILLLQVIFYVLALLYSAFLQSSNVLRPLKKTASLAFYFCIGNLGTLLGLIDFLMGRHATKWEPLKVG